MKKPPQKICRSFRQDFPEFVARAEALDVSIQLSKQKRKYGQDRVFWLDGYLQLTGYLRNSDGSPFTHANAVKNIDKILSENEADWKAVSGMTVAERFARVVDQMRKIEPQYRMIGCVELPCGDRGHCFFMAEYQGDVSLKGIGDVARAKAEWRKDERSPEQLTRFCDALEADFAARAIQTAETEAA